MITIELREDFKLGEEEDEQLSQAFPDKYSGNGIYNLLIADIVCAYFKVSET